MSAPRGRLYSSQSELTIGLDISMNDMVMMEIGDT